MVTQDLKLPIKFFVVTDYHEDDRILCSVLFLKQYIHLRKPIYIYDSEFKYILSQWPTIQLFIATLLLLL